MAKQQKPSEADVLRISDDIESMIDAIKFVRMKLDCGIKEAHDKVRNYRNARMERNSHGKDC